MPGLLTAIRALALGLSLALVLSGCAYDYLQHTDRVGYGAGNAVKANLASQTTNPSKGSTYSTGGLGKNGVVNPPPPPPN